MACWDLSSLPLHHGNMTSTFFYGVPIEPSQTSEHISSSTLVCAQRREMWSTLVGSALVAQLPTVFFYSNEDNIADAVRWENLDHSGPLCWRLPSISSYHSIAQFAMWITLSSGIPVTESALYLTPILNFNCCLGLCLKCFKCFREAEGRHSLCLSMPLQDKPFGGWVEIAGDGRPDICV